ncbi:MAG: shikimate dehydrogenase [Aequoribacter sp.]|uniref:shikimate dehydrogenase n=1 Tax=Aequoribacter sp. TaxID=2847771 RepID=UPI003C5B7FB6
MSDDTRTVVDQRKYAVFGNPIKQSRSPFIHAEFAKQTGMSFQYRAIRVELDDFERSVIDFFKAGGSGLNVTVPFKEQAYQLASRHSARAVRAKACNTLKPDGDGVYGDNTDGIGLIRDMVANHGWNLRGARVLLLGAGGAARGVMEPLLRESPECLVVANRTLTKAETLAQEFADLGKVWARDLTDLSAELAFDVIINATSAGLKGETPDLPDSLLGDRCCCYDMVYGAEPTAFMRWAAENAAWAVSDGLGMLVEQAAESFYIWHQERPDTASVINHLRGSLAAA